jgi:FkbM family methyltransferase
MKLLAKSVRTFLRIPYATSLLPSSLLARGIRSQSPMWRAWTLIALVIYGTDSHARRTLRNYLTQRRAHPDRIFQGQMLQDAWVDSLGINDTYFLDIGAAYPVKYSNSYSLQLRSWAGLLVEPNSVLIPELLTRCSSSVQLAPVAVALSSGRQTLVEYGPLSSLEESASRDIYAGLREKKVSAGSVETVSTLTFDDLMAQFSVPPVIGYLSIDVEGLDFDILQRFPFHSHQVAAITIEHNLDLQLRKGICSFLTAKGYVRVCRRWSSIDSWFVKADLID